MFRSSSWIRSFGWTLLCVAIQSCTLARGPGQDPGAVASLTLQALATIAAGWGPATGTVNPRGVPLGPNEARTGIHIGYHQNLG